MLSGADEVLEALEDHQMQLQGMAGMGKFVDFFRQEVHVHINSPEPCCGQRSHFPNGSHLEQVIASRFMILILQGCWLPNLNVLWYQVARITSWDPKNLQGVVSRSSG